MDSVGKFPVDQWSRLNDCAWTFSKIKEIHGIDLDESQSLLVQYKFWAGRYSERGKFVLDANRKAINRLYFELFLQERELIGLRMAAVRLALLPKILTKILDVARKFSMISEAEWTGDFPNTYRINLLRDIHKRFPKLRGRVFGDYQDYIRAIHSEFSELIKEDIEALRCVTSIALNEEDVSYAYDYDVLTGEPMGLPYQLALETPKPIQLPADTITLKTFVSCEDFLKDKLLGARIEMFDDQISILRSIK